MRILARNHGRRPGSRWRGSWHLVALLLLAATHGAAAEADFPPPIELRYALLTHGLTVAEMSLGTNAAADETRSRLELRTIGLASWFGGALSRMVATSRVMDDGTVRPRAFDALYAKQDRRREIVLRWSPEGAMSSATVASQGRRAKPSELPEALRRDVVDPLTGLLDLRRWLLAGPGEGAVRRLALFDGRKRADLEARLLPPAEAADPLTGATVPVQRLELVLRPRFGFEPGDGFVSWPGEPEQRYEVLLSADALLRPLLVRQDGATILTLTADCRRTPASCADPPAP